MSDESPAGSPVRAGAADRSFDRRSTPIVCRECDAVFPLAEGACPECGTAVRSRLGLAAVAASGVAVLALATVPGDRLSGFVGLILIAIAVAGARDRRRRIRDARARRRRPAS